MECSWDLLGPPGVLLGPSWAALGASWGRLGPLLISPSLYRRPRGSQGTVGPTNCWASLSLIFFTSFFFSFFTPSWPALGLHLGASWAPKLAPFWPKMHPSRLLKPHFFQKSNFHKNERHAAWEHDFDPKAGLKTAQDRPKIAPRQFQDALQELLFSSSFLSSILVRSGLDFGCLLGVVLEPHEGAPASTTQGDPSAPRSP